MKQLTIVYQIENQEHQTALLCAPNIIRVSHNDSILELTKAAGLALHQQNEIDNLHRGAALLRERLNQSEKSRKAAQIENEQLKERILRAGQDYKLELSKNINLQAMIDSIGAGGVESLRKNERLHQIVEPCAAAQEPLSPLEQLPDGHLYGAINNLLCHCAMEGSIDADHGFVHETMAALKKIDGGVYLPDLAVTPAGQPLAEAEIKSLYGESNFDVTGPYVIAFARAIEAAHGITNKV